jgi:hypothetical protein
LEAELDKRKAATVYQFGDCVPMEETQHLELKSCRGPSPNDTPPPEPFAHASLRKSITQYLTKYAAAFLNAQCVYPHLKGTSTITFGVHDDCKTATLFFKRTVHLMHLLIVTVDGFMTTDQEKDQTIRQINDMLDLLIRQDFQRNIEWVPVTTGADDMSLPQAYVVHVSVTPITLQMYCVDPLYGKDYTFWMRRDNQCKRMTFEEMEIGFHNSRG